VPKDYLTSNLVGHYHYMIGLTLEHDSWPAAEQALRRARAAAGDNDVLFYNLGLIYRRAGLFERSTAAFERAGAINPRHMASKSKPRPADKVAEARLLLAEAKRLQSRVEQANPGLRVLSPGSPDYHLLVADGLRAAGRVDLARGSMLCAQEIAAGISPEGDCGDL
jgi:tetratricopeptide (TPR) repeat protein